MALERMTMETMDHAMCNISVHVILNFFEYLQSKMSFEFIEISINVC